MIRLVCTLLAFSLLIVNCSISGVKTQRDQSFLLKTPDNRGPKKAKGYFLSELKLKGTEFKQMISSLIKKEWKQAIDQARAYLKKNPYHTGAFMVIASAQVALKNYDAAAYYARLVYRKNPNHAAALNILGLSRFESAKLMQDYRQAAIYFKLSFEKSVQEIAAGLNLGYLYLEIGDVKRADSFFLKLRKRCQDCTESLMGAAIAKNRLGRKRDFKRLVERVLVQNPKHQTALFQLALYYRNVVGDLNESSKLLKRILLIENPQFLDIKEKARHLLYSQRIDSSF